MVEEFFPFHVGLSDKALRKGPQMGAFLSCSKNIKGASVAERVSQGDCGRKGGL